MNKGIVVALAVSGSLLAGPAALAAPLEPAGSLPGYRLEHAGSDHGHDPAPDRARPGDEHGYWHWHGDGHGHHHRRGDDDSAHASGGYDAHRHHPRDW